jgi:hypothetical protein
MAMATKKQIAWEDKFRQPTYDEMVEHYPQPLLVLLEDARDRLSKMETMTETIEWNGLPLRWSLTYRLAGDPTRAFAYLAPDALGVRIQLPFTGPMLQAMPLHRFKRHLKDVMQNSQDVGGMFWTDFVITAKPVLDDVLDVARRKHALIQKANKVA